MRYAEPQFSGGFMRWTTEFRAGLKAIAPVIVAAMPIGLVFGAVAATKGLSPLETVLMSALVFAGGSQFVAMDIWTHPASWTTLGFAAFLVNIRHVLWVHRSAARWMISSPGRNISVRLSWPTKTGRWPRQGHARRH